MDLQAQDRCHRIGQTKPVLVLRLVSAGTVDQCMVERAAAKRKLEKIIIQNGQFPLHLSPFLLNKIFFGFKVVSRMRR